MVDLANFEIDLRQKLLSQFGLTPGAPGGTMQMGHVDRVEPSRLGGSVKEKPSQDVEQCLWTSLNSQVDV